MVSREGELEHETTHHLWRFSLRKRRYRDKLPIRVFCVRCGRARNWSNQLFFFWNEAAKDVIRTVRSFLSTMISEIPQVSNTEHLVVDGLDHG
jgi:hypothetical protein